MDNDALSTLNSVVDLFNTKLGEAFSKVNEVPSVVDTELKELAILNKSISNSGMQITEITSDKGQEYFRKFREILSILAYSGYEVFLIKRVDLNNPILDNTSAARAYLMDKNDVFFPTLNRLSLGYSIVFDVPQDANIPNVVMTFINTTLKFDSTTEDALELTAAKERFNALQSTNSGYLFNVEKILRFLNDYGYSIVVFI
jgi:hypothetical protein